MGLREICGALGPWWLAALPIGSPVTMCQAGARGVRGSHRGPVVLWVSHGSTERGDLVYLGSTYFFSF